MKRRHILTILVILGLIQPAWARMAPAGTLTEISEADLEEIRAVLDVDASRIFDVRAYEYPKNDESPPVIKAVVELLREELAPGVVQVSVQSCWKPDSAWSCKLPGRIAVHAELPEDCEVPRGPEPYRKTNVMIYEAQELAARAIRGLLRFVCTSDEMREEAWSKGHRLGAIEATEYGFEVRTFDPVPADRGLTFELEERCVNDRCELGIRRLGAWIT